VTPGICFAGHSRSFEELLELTRLAEAAGYAAVYVDGDVSVMDSRGDGDVLDGWTVTTALLMRTERIPIGSIRVAPQWNAARLAQAAATLERLAPGRLRFLIGTGDQRNDVRFGFPALGGGDRVELLEETVDALRALWSGETVTRNGRFVQLERARTRPAPGPGRPPLAIAAARPRALGVVARHADVWDVNLPTVRRRVATAERHLEEACRRAGRDPASLARSMLVFARPHRDPADPALAEEYRSCNPWFGRLPPTELEECVVAGTPATCRERIAELALDLQLELPVIDCSWLSYDATRRVLDALAPSENYVDSRG
jgi:alkanesulfonate monooxygenase SsuD/methylene tetrahydromethanopterin reductase-like flavin-dependent oxidoreductase (luciferase family)